MADDKEKTTMTERFANYDEFFYKAFADKDGKGQKPFDYQRRLALDELLPSLVNAPTGAGKTNSILGAWMWRRLVNPNSVGRRLVYCLPMRTLVEQTRDVARAAIKRLGFEERFRVRVLMGGDVDNEWEHHPESEAILIGTQDMLLSRALNRGYALSRFKWPVHFGLLNNDCLWVFDEVQLMSDGLATTAQLAAFRERFKTFGQCHSIWMSATLDRDWLRQIDFAPQVERLKLLELSDSDRAAEVLAKRLNAVKHLSPAPRSCRLPSGLAAFVRENHRAGTQTLVVVNTVNRAREVYDELNQAFGKAVGKGKKRVADVEPSADVAPEIELIHSRFRPAERARWKTLFNEKIDEASAGRIIVATQVIEAGVDISSRLLISDLAPFSSLVQRFGRCNRGGEFESAEIYWVDRPLTEKTSKLDEEENIEEGDLEKIAKPYEWQELKEAQEQLEQLQSASPSVLSGVSYRAPYTPAHVLRRRDLVDLFDTTPDLSGYDLDVSRFVRGGDERDVLIAWRQLNEQRPLPDIPRLTRNELCPVSIGEFKPFLKGKIAWTWNALERRWQKVGEGELRPGMTLLLDVKAGGYDQQRGWDAASKKEVALVEPETKKPEEALNDDPQSNWLDYVQTLAAHSREARQAAEQILGKLTDLPLTEWRDELVFATHHHDWGKVHPVFQETLHKGLDATFADLVLAKSTSHARHSRPRFRHELASALALLQTGASDLVVYLAACHHGKVRLSIRALPGEVKPEAADSKFARGIHDNDRLDAVDLGGAEKPALTLDLEPMLLGASNDGTASWLERMLALRDRVGVFRLAYLEALIRAADVRASANPQDFWTDQEVH
jgi:CRISPR-associated endonuclease/helicase Cas3